MADNTPARSGPGWIMEDPSASADNWVFFAVTYDGTQQFSNVQYYFGTPTQAAEPEFWLLDYDRSPILQSGALTVGNFGAIVGARTATGPTGSRVFRGLIDEINIFNGVLTHEEILAVQIAPARDPEAGEPPRLFIARETLEVVIEWDSAGVFELEETGTLGTQWNSLSVAPEINGNRRTVRLPLNQPRQFFRLRGN
jgi:hypothetical protein